MAKQARAKQPGIYGDNQQYRQAGEVFDVVEGQPVPDWAEEMTEAPTTSTE